MSHSTGAPSRQEDRVVYYLLLFVAGQEPNSILAHQNLETFCRTNFQDSYELEVVDVFKDHELALKHRVLVTPCLVLVAPPPSVMVAGTLRDEEKIRTALRVPKE